MIKNKSNRIISISAKIPEKQVEDAFLYVREKVLEHCRINSGEEFSVRILFGGEKRNWSETPLQPIYDYYSSHHYENPENRAARDVGLLMRRVLIEDKSSFIYVGKDTGSRYILAT